MYERQDRPSTTKIVLTTALVVAGIAAVVAVASVTFGAYTKANSVTSATTSATSSKAAAKARKPTVSASASTSRQESASVPAASPKVAAPAKAAPTVVAPAAAPAPAPAKPTAGVVVIDAGHQGKGDSSLEPIGPGSSQKKPKVADGASGSYAPHAESQVNLEVALKLQKALQARGIKVIMVRTTQNVNVSNSARAAVANNAHAALFIRLHCDGIGSSSTHGLSTLIPASNKWTAPIVSQSAKAGRIVHGAVIASTGAADRGVVNRGDLSGFNWAKVPTILVEMGFMSNPAEDKLLTTPSYQQKLADGMANGTVTYLRSR